jgi:hypothetical protein
MTGPRERRLCPTCGRVGYCDVHHPMGRAHVPDVVVDACVRVCHPVLGERHRNAGVVLDHGVERGAGEDVWAFASGIGDLLFLLAWNTPELGEQEARAAEAIDVAQGRVLDLVARAAGGDGIGGPEPRRNTMRIARRRHKRNADQSTPALNAPRSDPDTARERMAQLGEAFAGAMGAMTAHGASGEYVNAARVIADRQAVLFERFNELEDRGRADDLYACIQVGLDHRAATTDALQAVAQVNDLPERWPTAQAYEEFISRYTTFMVELSEATDADAAEQALDQLTAAVLPV